MKVSDYIVQFLAEKGITDVFGYPGGMVTHLMESFRHADNRIKAHVNYHEQASAFSACGYAQISMKPGIAYATSGPGATNLITGICNAYFDSIPAIFITGQVNTFESKKDLKVRQRGFQETDIVGMVKNVTKYCEYVTCKDDIRFYLEKAWHIAMEGRPGPVLLDIPMDIQRSSIDPDILRPFIADIAMSEEWKLQMPFLYQLINTSKRPCFVLGAGIKTSNAVSLCRHLIEMMKIPVVSSMPAIDVMDQSSSYYYGFLGAYGNRCANFILAKSDLIITLGTRLDIRQVGAIPKNFAENATLVRIDIDRGEFTNKVKENEVQICADIKEIIEFWVNEDKPTDLSFDSWHMVCNKIKMELNKIDDQEPNTFVENLSDKIPDGAVITTDVGQNQVWVAQSFRVKQNQRVLFSAGHGAMGYSLPAAIGACYAHNGLVISFNGDGGIQMNIQELQFIAREKLPIKVIILNNSSLGMIRHFQEMYFNSQYTQTRQEGGYTTPNFEKISNAYQLDYNKITSQSDINEQLFSELKPAIIEVVLPNETYVYPKLEYGKPNQDQEPPIERELYQHLMSL